MIDDMSRCKPQIDYPCAWVYKVIGRDREALRTGIAEVMTGTVHRVSPSHASRGGHYHCFNVELTVETEQSRLELYERLRSHAAVIMVM